MLPLPSQNLPNHKTFHRHPLHCMHSASCDKFWQTFYYFQIKLLFQIFLNDNSKQIQAWTHEIFLACCTVCQKMCRVEPINFQALFNESGLLCRSRRRVCTTRRTCMYQEFPRSLFSQAIQLISWSCTQRAYNIIRKPMIHHFWFCY